ncbi:hypothetical protein, partial [Streptococcus pneumoniae]|uniref:hypothetical protein n=1 Tax=Streptococcus pneumoniae TaxID=1313 RepID=UPI001E34B092
IIEFVKYSGDTPRFRTDGLPNSEDWERDTFAQFLSKIVQERFVIDAIAVELVKTRNQKQLSGYYVVDGARIYKTAYKDWPYG